MNVERLKLVRDNIATMPETDFCMSVLVGVRQESGYVSAVWGGDVQLLSEGDNPCGTAACIAGRTCYMFKPDTVIDKAVDVATDLLDLTSREADHLFLGKYTHGDLADISRDQAVRVLDTFIETGVISWNDVGVPKDIVDDENINRS